MQINFQTKSVPTPYLSLPSRLSELIVNIAFETFEKQEKSNYYRSSVNTLFKGNIVDGKVQNGMATILFPTGEKFKGWLEDGVAQGSGKLYLQHGYHLGAYVKGQPNGYGYMTSTANASEYRGDFKDGLKHGKGVMTYADGRKYSGDFENDEPHGDGTITYSNANVYTGKIERGTPHGNGKMLYKNGDTYQGSFLNGFEEGEGTYTFSNGERHIGTFCKGQPHGRGTFIASDYTLEGTYDEGNRVGFHKRTSKDGKVTTLHFSAEKKVYTIVREKFDSDGRKKPRTLGPGE